MNSDFLPKDPNPSFEMEKSSFPKRIIDSEKKRRILDKARDLIEENKRIIKSYKKSEGVGYID